MNETLTLIDNYFNKELTASEKKVFEERCISDPEFAKEVAFYVSARDILKRELYDQKKEEFSELHHRLSLQNSASKGGAYRKLIRFASLAAACLLLFIGWQLFFMKPSPAKLADGYFKNNFEKLSKTMAGSPDSLQTAISAYNEKQYQEAETIFKALSNRKDPDHESVKNLGIVYLARGEYDNALIQFDHLSNISSASFANEGPFLKALTLMKRSSGNDADQAKKLLQEIVEQDLPGKKDAENWLKEF